MPDERPDPAPRAISVAIEAFVRGRELAGEGQATLSGESLILDLPRGRVMIPLRALDGLRLHDGTLELFADAGDYACLSATEGLAAMHAALAARVCALPQITLSLRGLGSRRARPGDEHDHFFAPLLAARRQAERSADAAGRLSAFVPSALRTALEEQLREFARVRHPDSAPDRRATEAVLEECVEPLWPRLEALDAAERAVRSSAPESVLLRWRAWTRALVAVFECADGCWLAMQPLLLTTHVQRRRGWRRWLGRRRGER